MKKTALIILLIMLIAVALAGCGGKEIRADDIKFIEIRDGSFKTTYAVDEKIDFRNVYIVITLKDNKGEVVEKVTNDMLEGFDTSTTTASMEMRTMRVKYKGMFTSNWNYTVASPYAINTKARLRLSGEKAGSKYKLNLRMELDEIPQINALQIQVNYDATRLTFNNESEGGLAGWEINKVSTKSGSFDMLYYAAPGAQPFDEDGSLTTLVFDVLSDGDFNIEITNIHVSLGESDIYLPDAALK